MKSLSIYCTILFYSIFSFAFAAICPAVCVTIGPEDVCELVCGEVQESCCESSCSTPCPDVDALAFCYGAYGVQNSLRTSCDCPAKERSVTIAEVVRLLKDVDAVPVIVSIIRSDRTTDRAVISLVSAPSDQTSEIIATTVLRI